MVISDKLPHRKRQANNVLLQIKRSPKFTPEMIVLFGGLIVAVVVILSAAAIAGEPVPQTNTISVFWIVLTVIAGIALIGGVFSWFVHELKEAVSGHSLSDTTPQKKRDEK